MISEKMRRLVDALDQKHKEYVRSIHTFGKVTPIASEKANEYKGLQREIVKTENEDVLTQRAMSNIK